MAGPVFQGVTEAGEAINLSASQAKPDTDNNQRTLLTDFTARLSDSDVETLRIEAAEGEINNTDDVAILTGGTRTTTHDGIVATTETLTASLTENYAESAGEVIAIGPFGTLKAGKMIIQRPSKDDDQLIIFQDGVSVLYDNDEE